MHVVMSCEVRVLHSSADKKFLADRRFFSWAVAMSISVSLLALVQNGCLCTEGGFKN
jgi:hypothetical protein